jgi:hypothetical protein
MDNSLKLFLNVKPNDLRLDELRDTLSNKNMRKILNICFNVFVISDSVNKTHTKNGNIDIISIMFSNFFINFNLFGHDIKRTVISMMNHEKQNISILSNVFINKLLYSSLYIIDNKFSYGKYIKKKQIYIHIMIKNQFRHGS